jgi:hypothetical protein
MDQLQGSPGPNINELKDGEHNLDGGIMTSPDSSSANAASPVDSSLPGETDGLVLASELNFITSKFTKFIAVSYAMVLFGSTDSGFQFVKYVMYS